MDSTTKKILFEIDIKDNSKGTWERLDKNMDTLEGKTSKVGDEMDKTAGKTVAGGEKMSSSITKGVVTGNLLIEAFKLLGDVAKQAFGLAVDGAKAFVNLAIEGDLIGDVAGRFEKNFKKSEQALARFRKASGGTISDFQLMKSASQVSSFGITTDSAKIAEIWRFSRAKAEELGVSTEEVFSQITTAVGKGRDAQLKELGLTTDGYDRLIKKMGDSADKLTDRQKAQLLLNDVLVQSKKVQDAEIDGYEVLQTSIKNAKDAVAVELTPVLNDLANAVLPLVKSGIEGVKKFLDASKDPTSDLGKAFGDMKTALIGDKGLIKSVEKLLGSLSDPNTIKNISKLVDSMTAMVDGLTWLINHQKELSKLGEVLKFIFMPQTVVQDNVKWLYDKLGGGNKQAGGIIQKAGKFTVGEMGREEVFLPQGSKVVPNSNNGGNSTINVNISGAVYGVDQLKTMVIGAVTEAQRNQNYLGRYNLL